jgi:hypothetical protein
MAPMSASINARPISIGTLKAGTDGATLHKEVGPKSVTPTIQFPLELEASSKPVFFVIATVAAAGSDAGIVPVRLDKVAGVTVKVGLGNKFELYEKLTKLQLVSALPGV